MIEIFEGRIGGGKTYAAVERICLAASAGQTIYSNIDINYEGIRRFVARYYGYDLPEENETVLRLPPNIHGWHKEIKWGQPGCNSLVIIDEAHLWYNARDWKATGENERDMLSFLTQSRKACVDVIFITQAASNLEKQFRVLAQYLWKFRDCAKMGVPLVGWAFSGYFFCICCDYAGAVIKTQLKPKNKLIFKAYETLAFLDPRLEEQARKERARSVAKKKLGKVGLVKRFWLSAFPAVVFWLDDRRKKKQKECDKSQKAV